MEWMGLISGLLGLAGKVIDIEHLKMLREHSDKLTDLGRSLQIEQLKPYDDMDDFRIADIKTQIKQTQDAFARDIALAAGQNATSNP